MSDSALSDMRVIDCSRVLAGSYCTMMLADYGAEVSKIEQPGQGEGTRQWGPNQDLMLPSTADSGSALELI